MLSAGIIPVHFFGPNRSQPKFLLLRVYASWDFPKGVVEPGETPLQAALRELREETTLDGAELCWGEDSVDTEPYSRGKIARYYLAQVARTDVRLLPNPELGHPEHHEFRWVPAEDAEPLLPARLQGVLRWACVQIAATR